MERSQGLLAVLTWPWWILYKGLGEAKDSEDVVDGGVVVVWCQSSKQPRRHHRQQTQDYFEEKDVKLYSIVSRSIFRLWNFRRNVLAHFDLGPKLDSLLLCFVAVPSSTKLFPVTAFEQPPSDLEKLCLIFLLGYNESARKARGMRDPRVQRRDTIVDMTPRNKACQSGDCTVNRKERNAKEKD